MTYESEWEEMVFDFYGSPFGRLTLNPHLGTPEETEPTMNYAQRGGVFVFSRNSGGGGELHSIRIHESVEAPVVDGYLSSRIDNIQPFNIVASSDFSSRGFRSPSVFIEDGAAVILSNSEVLEWYVEGENEFDSSVAASPQNLSVVESASNITPTGKRTFCLYMNTGNVYAGRDI